VGSSFLFFSFLFFSFLEFICFILKSRDILINYSYLN
jgi:hypothetical protein